MNRDDFDYKVEVALDDWLEENTFDEFLERLGYTPFEVLMHCYETGLITDQDIECFMPTDIRKD